MDLNGLKNNKAMDLIKYAQKKAKLMQLNIEKCKIERELFRSYDWDLFYKLQDLKREIRKTRKTITI